jgi:cytochrome c2
VSETTNHRVQRPDSRHLLFAGFAIIILIGLVGFVLAANRVRQGPRYTRAIAYAVEGDWERGRHLLNHYGCATCHQIDGIGQGRTYVGPPLVNWPQRRYIAGNLPNTPEHLIAWIIDPQAVEPGTAMPDLGVTEEEARHISAYLYSLDN